MIFTKRKKVLFSVLLISVIAVVAFLLLRPKNNVSETENDLDPREEVLNQQSNEALQKRLYEIEAMADQIVKDLPQLSLSYSSDGEMIIEGTEEEIENLENHPEYEQLIEVQKEYNRLLGEMRNS
jgi:hypothetical protein